MAHKRPAAPRCTRGRWRPQPNKPRASHPFAAARSAQQPEYGIGGKWLELLKEIAPKVTRVAVLRDPAIASGIGIFGVIQAMAASHRMEVAQVNLRDAGEVEDARRVKSSIRRFSSNRPASVLLLANTRKTRPPTFG